MEIAEKSGNEVAKRATARNYTPEQAARLVEAYVQAEGVEGRKSVVETFASGFGKTPASIRAKLVSEGVYQAVTRAAKPRVTKANLVSQIAEVLGESEERVESLEKANRSVLETLLTRL